MRTREQNLERLFDAIRYAVATFPHERIGQIILNSINIMTPPREGEDHRLNAEMWLWNSAEPQLRGVLIGRILKEQARQLAEQEKAKPEKEES